jgi:aminomethyltransferase
VQWLTTNDASKLAVGQAQYSALATPEGTFVDDILVYRLAGDHYLLVVNAGSTSADHVWIREHVAAQGGDVSIVNSSSRYSLIAVQGPAAQSVVQPLATVDLDTLRYYWFAHGEVAGVRALVSRTGYTGEDGFEIFIPPASAGKVWDALLDAGRGVDIRPCGLGARDTLRLEAGMRLSGQDMGPATTVIEAGLGWIVGWGKPPFLGSDRLQMEREAGPRRKLAAFEMVDRAIARHGHRVLRDDEPCGEVTSGTQTPFLKKAIGFALVPADMAVIGGTLEIDVRGRRAAARVVAEPFYKRPKAAPRA